MTEAKIWQIFDFKVDETIKKKNWVRKMDELKNKITEIKTANETEDSDTISHLTKINYILFLEKQIQNIERKISHQNWNLN